MAFRLLCAPTSGVFLYALTCIYRLYPVIHRACISPRASNFDMGVPSKQSNMQHVTGGNDGEDFMFRCKSFVGPK